MTSLGHVNIRTSQLEVSVGFYRDVLGLTPGRAATRPHSSDHVWMSDAEGRACVHLQRTNAGPPSAAESAGVHHVAFDCTDPDAWRRKLASLGVDYTAAEFTEANLLQLNIVDPNGVRLELLFRGEE